MEFMILVFEIVVISLFYGYTECKYKNLWRNHKIKYSLNFENKEEIERYKIFSNNQEIIKSINKRNSTFIAGNNKFSHYTQEEYLNRTGLNFNAVLGNYTPPKTPKKYFASIPKKIGSFLSFDKWREMNYVLPVKDQRSCGSCWAFSAIAAIESHIAIKTGLRIPLSEQQLVDCVFEDSGCYGGVPTHAFHYATLHGIETEEYYSYTAEDQTCRYNPKSAVAKLKSYFITGRTEYDLEYAIRNIGPISVAIDASNPSFRFYKKGVYHEPKCSSIYINHAVLAVGFGTSLFGGEYYIVKNSWGEGWGEKGYVRMARNKDNNCGIATFGSFPVL